MLIMLLLSIDSFCWKYFIKKAAHLGSLFYEHRCKFAWCNNGYFCLASDYVMNVCIFHVYAGTIHMKIAELYLCVGRLHVKSAVFLVYTRDILV